MAQQLSVANAVYGHLEMESLAHQAQNFYHLRLSN
jgi:hypothetical protein